jgi:hypothetical protein
MADEQKPYPPDSSHLAYLHAQDVTFTQAQWARCTEKHDAPLFGCPVCFLLLVEKAPYAEMGIASAQQVLSLTAVDAESLKYAQAVVADIASIPNRVRSHLRPSRGAGEE